MGSYPYQDLENPAVVRRVRESGLFRGATLGVVVGQNALGYMVQGVQVCNPRGGFVEELVKILQVSAAISVRIVVAKSFHDRAPIRVNWIRLSFAGW